MTTTLQHEAPCDVCDGTGEVFRYLGEGDTESVPCDACVSGVRSGGNPVSAGPSVRCAVVSLPETPHYCRPGWEARWHEQTNPADILDLPSGWYLHPLNLPVGTVVRCDCGQVWIAKAMRPTEAPGLVTHRVHWRKPTWCERRRLRQVPR